MIEQILAKAAQMADEAEVFELISDYTPVNFENNKLKSVSTRSSAGYALRIIKDGRIGFSSTTRPDAAGLVEAAINTAQFGQKAVYHLPGQPSSEPKVNVFDQGIEDLPIDKMVEAGQQALDAIRAAGPDAQVGVNVAKDITTHRLINTHGLDISWKSTYCAISGGVEIIHGTDMLQVWESRDSRSVISSDDFVSTVIRRMKQGRDIAPLQTCNMPVIFTPKGFEAALLGPITIAFNGKEVLQGATPVSGKMNEQAIDPRVSLYNDGTIDFASGARPYDDEGLAVGRLSLIEKGVVCNFIYDLESAAKAGKESTSSGQRGLGSLPGPCYNTIVIEPGNAPLEDMIKSVKCGLLVDQTMGAWAGNVRAGEVSGNVHYGLKIENGELVGRVKDVIITLNVFDALNNIEAIENISHMPTGELSVPHILFSDLSVAAK